ncbi:DUF2301 domain-containing membrane protein [Romeria aff. gracilis LEGE 07310]|uniref:DUF2301 domain-containing membrane protein n=1 Tax=Vasconcelosia minhoensis LEGE 07310 TaxID=915328 RepID=A0A8J7AFY6_9CYAN|nr:DUF2301 domain-containing membrane protein [Romeria gracilis]MBE9076783.1 DUF2301 domain-containing membrane protein [Romeria aff. gracilis LEGE 07310]
MQSEMQSEVYEGQFGNFTIEPEDRREVVIYRAGLAIAAISFAVGTLLTLQWGAENWAMQAASVCYVVLWVALGVSLSYIHIYLRALHRAIQVFWAVGGVASLGIALTQPGPLALTVYQQPLTILGIGFTFASLTGIFFKEAVCFNRFETKLLAPIVPLLLLGHLVGFLPASVEAGLLAAWAILFGVFALRKGVQPIPPDIGDKSVFAYLAQQREQQSSAV